MCIYVFSFTWVNLSEKKNIWTAMSKDILSDLLLVYCFIAVWFVGGLTIFHSYLICTNQVKVALSHSVESKYAIFILKIKFWKFSTLKT